MRPQTCLSAGIWPKIRDVCRGREGLSELLKLNLGCGARQLAGYCNVDKFGTPDLRCDLEVFPWPWTDNAVSEVLLSHTLEHLGASVDVFLGIMKELYRVCADGAQVTIVVPHPRHDFYLADPTHVRPISVVTMELFSKKLNRIWQDEGASNTPLALYHDVDFELLSVRSVLDEPYKTRFVNQQITPEELMQLERTLNNMVAEIEMVLKVVK
jgi:hypothetical protein